MIFLIVKLAVISNFALPRATREKSGLPELQKHGLRVVC